MNIVKRFLRDETAATAIEYGLIAAGISLAIISAVRGLGTNLGSKFTSINTSLK
ncbi:MAG: Flp family type IVb pilin [Afipia sp.]|nr:Flp family type IVb pilin [Afipia sp.]